MAYLSGGRLEEKDGRKKAKLEDRRPLWTTNRDDDGSRENRCRDNKVESVRLGVHFMLRIRGRE